MKETSHSDFLPKNSQHEVGVSIEIPPKNSEYELLDHPDLRYKYVKLTERLIAKAISEDIDTLIFLDKSARPVAWLLKELWPTLGFKDFDADGNPITSSLPDIKFVNFDREQWAPVMGRSEGRDGKGITLDGLHPDTIDSLTGLFAVKNMDADDFVAPDDETLFDDKHVLIVDEVSASGDTLAMAERLFEKAFKNAASIDGTHWMSPDKKVDRKSGGIRNADVPVWYVGHSPYGRLVGDRDLYRSGHSNSMRQRRGAQFLSYPFAEPDQKGIKLRNEMKRLGQDVSSGAMPVVFDAVYRPDSQRFQDLYMQRINHMSVDDFVKLRVQAEEESIPFPTLVEEFHASKSSAA